MCLQKFDYSFYPMGIGIFFGGGGVKELENESDHSPPSSAEIKNAWNYTCVPPYIFRHGV
jgi:hypothetical protein